MIIGIIDSGVGGAYLEQQINKLFPSIETIRYIPSVFETYSNTSIDRLCLLSKHHIEYIYSKAKEQQEIPSVIIVACMTLSTNCLEFIKSLVSLPTVVLDMLSCLPFLTNNTTVFATVNTIKSGRFNYCLEVPCLDLSSKIESYIQVNRQILSREDLFDLKQYTNKLNILCSPVIVLGCSHYSLIKKEFQRTFNPVSIIDPVDILFNYITNIQPDFF